jgi:cobalt-precorrin 5A hydrolase
MIFAGFGCRAGVSAEALFAVLREAELMSNTQAIAIAAPAFKQSEAAFDELAHRRGLKLHWIDDDALAEVAPLCPTQSDIALRETGHASIAEAAALAAAGPGAILILSRIAHPTATCALARKAKTL